MDFSDPPDPGELLIHADQLSKRYGETLALDGLSFQLRGGDLLGLLGPNGAGKTTTLKLLLGLLRPSAGSATVAGLDCTHRAKEVKRQLGYTPDEPAFFDFLTGRETLDFAGQVRGLDKRAMWRDLDPLVAALELGPQLAQYTSGYDSHGMKKKLALLLALAHKLRALLLDEPTNGLDPPMAAAVRHLLQERAPPKGRGCRSPPTCWRWPSASAPGCWCCTAAGSSPRLACRLAPALAWSAEAPLEEAFLKLVLATGPRPRPCARSPALLQLVLRHWSCSAWVAGRGPRTGFHLGPQALACDCWYLRPLATWRSSSCPITSASCPRWSGRRRPTSCSGPSPCSCSRWGSWPLPQFIAARCARCGQRS